MAEVLLINPRRRKARKSGAPKRRASSSSKRRVRRVRRSNPAPVVSTMRRVTRRRRANPIGRITRRRRRNPIGGSAKLSARSIIAMFKDAAVGGAGAIGMDILWGKVNPMLPTSIRTNPTAIGAGDAVKAIATAALGKLLKKPTRGLSEKMALGALTTQARDLLSGVLPASMTAQLAYYNPAAVVRGTARVGPIRTGMSAYQRPGGQTALLNAYQAPGGASPIVRSMTPRQREGAIR